MSDFGKLFVLSAPSGAGKTTLKDMLLKDFSNLKYSISATTRPKRGGEKEGEHYFFKSKDEFEKMIQDQEFVEYNQVHGNYYGTPNKPIQNMLKNGFHVIFDLDVYGKINFDKFFSNAVGILILPPSESELKKRLTQRKSESSEALNLRLKNARDEIEFAKTKGKYEYQVINDDLENAYVKLKNIVNLEMGQTA